MWVQSLLSLTGGRAAKALEMGRRILREMSHDGEKGPVAAGVKEHMRVEESEVPQVMVEGLAMLHKIPPSSQRLPVLGRIPPKKVSNRHACD